MGEEEEGEGTGGGRGLEAAQPSFQETEVQ